MTFRELTYSTIYTKQLFDTNLNKKFNKMEPGKITNTKGIGKRRLIKMYFKPDMSHEDFLEVFEIIKRNYFRYCNHISKTSQVLSENRIIQEAQNDYEFLPKLVFKKRMQFRFKEIDTVTKKVRMLLKFPKKDYCILKKNHMGETYYYFFRSKEFLMYKSLKNVKRREYEYVMPAFFNYIIDCGIMVQTLNKGYENEVYEFKEGYFNNIKKYFGFHYSEIDKLAYMEQLKSEGLDYLVKKNFLK